MRLLLVEDDTTLGENLKSALVRQGYGVDWLQDGEAGLFAAQDQDYSLMILDVNLPYMSGIEIVRNVRARKNNVPILILTARDTPSQRVEGLDSGADDYVVKPFDLDELFARLRSLQRRREGRTDTCLRCGNVELDPAAHIVRQDGREVPMAAKEYRLLKMLMERAGRYVTKGDIEYGLYSADAAAESNTVEVAVYTLRKKLGSDFIHTIRGVGYMVRP